MTEPIDHADWLRRLEQVTTGFAALLGSADLTRSVPGCPGWNLADLAAHLGGIHAWAEHAVVAGNPDAVDEPAPTGHAELVRWYRDRAVRAAGPAGPDDAGAWIRSPWSRPTRMSSPSCSAATGPRRYRDRPQASILDSSSS